MSSALALGIVVSLVDRASRPVRELAGTFQRLSSTLTQVGAASLGVGAGLLRVTAPMVRAYADLDEGMTRLRATLMDSSGTVPPVFKDLSSLALDLGNLLPGTTNDFYRMFDVMLSGGASATDVLGTTATHQSNNE